MQDEIVLFLTISGCDDPSWITQTLGMEPTAAWATGDPVPGDPLARRESGAWYLGTPLSRGARLDEHLEALLPRIEARAGGLAAVTQYYPAALTCGGYFHHANPALHLPPRLLGRIAALGLPLNLDLHWLPATG